MESFLDKLEYVMWGMILAFWFYLIGCITVGKASFIDVRGKKK